MIKQKQTPYRSKLCCAAVTNALLLIALLSLSTCNTGLNSLLELQREMYPVQNYDELADAIDGAPENGQPRVIGLVKNIRLSGTITIGNNKNITLTAFDRAAVITAEDTPAMNIAPFIAVEGGGSLTLGHKLAIADLVLDGENNASRSNSLVSVASITGATASLTMNDRVILQNNKTSSGSGGGVIIQQNGVFIMHGGIIRYNTVSNDGGGVYISNNGNFTMAGKASMYGNDAYVGGGVCIVDDGTFTMADNTALYGNYAGNGGGVDISGAGSFTMKDNASIHNNILNTLGAMHGGGIHMEVNATFTMNGNTSVYGNPAKDGGGVYMEDDSTFHMNGGSINGNTVSNDGGGVYMKVRAKLIMHGGSINGNTASNDGGGVYSSNNEDYCFQMNGGTIYDNIALAGENLYVEAPSAFYNLVKIIILNENYIIEYGDPFKYDLTIPPAPPNP